jgi:hypothetical protein
VIEVTVISAYQTYYVSLVTVVVNPSLSVSHFHLVALGLGSLVMRLQVCSDFKGTKPNSPYVSKE